MSHSPDDKQPAPQIPDAGDAMASIVRCVRAAARMLSAARFHLDDLGYEYEPLNFCAADVAALLAVLEGRHVPEPPPEPPPVPDYIEKSAREWRRENGRSY